MIVQSIWSGKNETAPDSDDDYIVPYNMTDPDPDSDSYTYSASESSSGGGTVPESYLSDVDAIIANLSGMLTDSPTTNPSNRTKDSEASSRLSTEFMKDGFEQEVNTLFETELNRVFTSKSLDVPELLRIMAPLVTGQQTDQQDDELFIKAMRSILEEMQLEDLEDVQQLVYYASMNRNFMNHLQHYGEGVVVEGEVKIHNIPCHKLKVLHPEDIESISKDVPHDVRVLLRGYDDIESAIAKIKRSLCQKSDNLGSVRERILNCINLLDPAKRNHGAEKINDNPMFSLLIEKLRKIADDIRIRNDLEPEHTEHFVNIITKCASDLESGSDCIYVIDHLKSQMFTGYIDVRHQADMKNDPEANSVDIKEKSHGDPIICDRDFLQAAWIHLLMKGMARANDSIRYVGPDGSKTTHLDNIMKCDIANRINLLKEELLKRMEHGDNEFSNMFKVMEYCHEYTTSLRRDYNEKRRPSSVKRLFSIVNLSRRKSDAGSSMSKFTDHIVKMYFLRIVLKHLWSKISSIYQKDKSLLGFSRSFHFTFLKVQTEIYRLELFTNLKMMELDNCLKPPGNRVIFGSSVYLQELKQLSSHISLNRYHLSDRSLSSVYFAAERPNLDQTSAAVNRLFDGLAFCN